MPKKNQRKLGSIFGKEILGKEILRLVSPAVEQKAVALYQKIKTKTKEKIKNW